MNTEEPIQEPAQEDNVPDYVLLTHKDFLNLRKVMRRFPAVATLSKGIVWENCWDQEGKHWHGLVPSDWIKVSDAIRAWPHIQKVAEDLQIDIKVAEKL